MSAEVRSWALVTGASRGIGAAIAEQLAAAGHGILLNYRSNHEAAEQVRARIVEAGGAVELLPFDVANADASGAALASVLESDKVISVVVNNAGVSADAPFPALEREAWDSVLGPTLDGFYNVTRPLVMPMVRRRHGRIINISSVSGLIGNRGQVNYSAAKAGIIGATKALARELAKRKITVNAVAPGLIETEMAAHAPSKDMVKLIPMRRMGTAQEVAKLVRFLASDDAAYVTGQVVAIDGGLT
ncbi:3-oxoacyl-[acyl-carrier-protein] reductase FabG [Enhygromyxa salina]|uniref:3-oxoacyl-[acyl-carrier-protein] reductase FabG n=1 Tax=Enhygromyxa salina TaxID=215803 RepID=A0A2S9YF02_9BACT|nr:3-oxoacyl-ACP reductase FabG [Enhygromyxa salina]PRQ03683.1 3-oxoacyl-[acyl-carrier-protein] reductase FabG [Enhygromyxa salina]